MSSTLYCMLMGIVLFCPESDGTGSSITWSEPLPIQTISNENQIHSSSTQLLEGTINANLSWLFSLSSDLTFSDVNLRFNDNIIGAVDELGDVVVASGFEDKFDIRWTPSGRVTLVIFKVTTEENGTFGCDVLAKKVGTLTFKSTTQVDVVGPPRNIAVSRNQTVRAPFELTLECSADGNPKPNTTWTRLPNNSVVIMPLNITGGQNTESYRCTADNGLGTLAKDVVVNVQFRPIVTLASKFYVEREQTATLKCEVEGNPTPSINWRPCDLPTTGCDKEYLDIPNVQTSRAYYTCTAANKIGEDSETTILIIGGKNVYLRISINADCDKNDSEWEALKDKLGDVLANTSYTGTRLRDTRCGSLIFELVLIFSTEVGEDDIINIMRTAVSEGKFGDISINASSIIGIPPVIPTTTTSSTTTTPKSESDNTWIIVVAVLGAVAVVVIIAIIVWCVRKKKCSNETKEVSDGNDAGQGRGGGAQGQTAGDESAYDSAYSNASVLPPSKKPTNTGKEDSGQAIALPVYAQVDKSKKKPRSEKEAQRQPGELLYVQADHSNEGSLPTKASGNPSRPPPYQDTVYADLV